MAKTFNIVTDNGSFHISVKSGTAPVAADRKLTVISQDGSERVFPLADCISWLEVSSPRGADKLQDAVDAAKIACNTALSNLHGVANHTDTLVPEDLREYIDAAATLRTATKELAAYQAKTKAAAIKREAEKLNPPTPTISKTAEKKAAKKAAKK